MENTWVAEEDISQDVLDELDETTLGASYVLQQELVVPLEQAEELAREWIDDLGRKGAKMLDRTTTEEYASRKVHDFSPCPAWLFRAIHAGIRTMSSEFQGPPRAPTCP